MDVHAGLQLVTVPAERLSLSTRLSQNRSSARLERGAYPAAGRSCLFTEQLKVYSADELLAHFDGHTCIPSCILMFLIIFRLSAITETRFRS